MTSPSSNGTHMAPESPMDQPRPRTDIDQRISSLKNEILSVIEDFGKSSTVNRIAECEDLIEDLTLDLDSLQEKLLLAEKKAQTLEALAVSKEENRLLRVANLKLSLEQQWDREALRLERLEKVQVNEAFKSHVASLNLAVADKESEISWLQEQHENRAKELEDNIAAVALENEELRTVSLTFLVELTAQRHELSTAQENHARLSQAFAQSRESISRLEELLYMSVDAQKAEENHLCLVRAEAEDRLFKAEAALQSRINAQGLAIQDLVRKVGEVEDERDQLKVLLGWKSKALDEQEKLNASLRTAQADMQTVLSRIIALDSSSLDQRLGETGTPLMQSIKDEVKIQIE